MVTEPLILRFPRGGVGKLTIRSDPELADVCSAEFSGTEAWLQVDGRTIEACCDHSWWPFGRTGIREAAVTLSEKAPWRVEVRGGVGFGKFDLRGVDLAGIRLEGGVAKLSAELGQPRGTAEIIIRGGLALAELRRPAGVPARVRLHGGAGAVTLDSERFAGIGGDTNWESPGYAGAANRYDIIVQGGCAQFRLNEV